MPNRIPYGAVRGGVIYNFGKMRRMSEDSGEELTPESYRTDDPQWETILDFDKLAADENENWVYKGSVCLAPDFTRCMSVYARRQGRIGLPRIQYRDRKLCGGWI